jgi:tetratricopeptide (TPR) repeat protein
VEDLMRRPLTVAGILALAGVLGLGLLLTGGVLGAQDRPAVAQVAGPPPATDRLAGAISRAQERLRAVPGDWRTWAALASSYVEQARVTADPAYYPKAQGAAARSLTLHPDGNPDALVALGALANARHDFAAARDHAQAALAVNGYSADAYGVLADAQTQLGNVTAATDAVQHLLDLRPGLAAYTRASYDLEQRGRADEAAELMRRALTAALDPHDIAFCRNQLGDLAWQRGDLAGALAEYTAGLAADPTSVALRRGRARVDAAAGRTDAALAGYADLTRRAPTPSNLLEYADLLRAAGRTAEAATQVGLADAAHQLFVANGGTDGLMTAGIALATGHPAEAVTAARAEWARRQHVDVADTLAWSLHAAGHDTEALGYAHRVLATGARDASYAYHLGAIEAALGQWPAARTDLERALSINPNFSPTEAPMARQLLAEAASR